MSLTQEEKRRYARQVILPGVGVGGQIRLKEARVLVIGAGGLGSPLLYYLAAAGVGTLGIVDHDTVDRSNLHRQILFETGDISRSKTESAQDALLDLNPDISLHLHPYKAEQGNLPALLAGYDLVADGCDDVATRFAVHEACYQVKKTLVSAAVHQFQGQISTYKAYLGGEHPCYQCLYPAVPSTAMPACNEAGILGAVAGVLGSVQAVEVVKELLGLGEGLSGTLLRYDGLCATFSRSILRPDPECVLCNDRRVA